MPSRANADSGRTSPPARAGRVAIWLARGGFLLMLGVVALGLIRPDVLWRMRGAPAISRAAPVPNDGAISGPPSEHDPAAAGRLAEGFDAPTNRADDDAPTFRTRLAGGVAELARQTQPVFDEAGPEAADPLWDVIEQADDMLARAKRANREAIRQANRQIRLRRGLAPNVVLVLAPRARREQLGCHGGAEPTPHLDQLATQGVVVEQLRLPESTAEANLRRLYQLGPRPPTRGRLRNLPAAFWQAGYDTAVVGDFSWTTISRHDDGGFDEHFGWATAPSTYPASVISGGATIEIPANNGSAPSVSVDRLIAAQTVARIGRPATERPFLLIVSMPANVATLDALVGEIDAALARSRARGNTVLTVLTLGTPGRSPAESEAPALGGLLMRWPTRTPAGARLTTPLSLDDLPPTLLDMVSARDRPPSMAGASAWTTIQTSAPSDGA